MCFPKNLPACPQVDTVEFHGGEHHCASKDKHKEVHKQVKHPYKTL